MKSVDLRGTLWADCLVESTDAQLADKRVVTMVEMSVEKWVGVLVGWTAEMKVEWLVVAMVDSMGETTAASKVATTVDLKVLMMAESKVALMVEQLVYR